MSPNIRRSLPIVPGQVEKESEAAPEGSLPASIRRGSSTRWLIVAAVLAIAAYAGYRWLERPASFRLVTAPVTRGPIVRTVTATGTVNPVITVQVGTYVSGPIIAMHVDFNSRVKAGELMAKIDPRPFAAQVALSRAALANAEAQLTKDEANLAYQKVTYERDAALLKDAVVSQDQLDSQHSTFEQAVAQIGLDRASIQQQRANLNAAELNLNYTNIIAPVDGTVVSRNVDVGQTVAASFQTPTLFLVAKDLTKMQLDTNVSESDVGGVQIGQPVDFTVDAYGPKVFKGTVAQVRQAPITVQNVVTYDVVVGVANTDLLLMPGMTANVTVITARRDDVLRVPLGALTFSPHHRMTSSSRSADSNGYNARVWVEDGTKLRPVRIVRGLDDGTYAEVVRGDLKPGEAVVTGKVGVSGHAGEGNHAFSRGPQLHM